MSNALKTAVLLAALTGVLLLVGQLVGGVRGLTIAIIFSVLINFVMYYSSDRIALAMYRAHPADEHKDRELFQTVRELAQRADLPMPKVYIIPSQTPNAFATGRNPQHASVAVTQGIQGLLSKHELKGVIAHELAHVKHRDILIATVAATIAGIISYVAMMARWAAIFGGFGGRDGDNNIVSLLVLAVLTPILAVIIQLAISRSREFAADAGGAKIMGHGEYLANALQKLEAANKRHPLRFGTESGASLFIVNPFAGRAFIKLFSTHPPVKERVKRLRT
ncbi:zinc metalloprotease HtpX, partial [Candidatus Woesearchaeota archaeon]|nr:zinc metalloprotease HtpX [Candidatus Woesearchaeota archaeon]